MEQALVEPGLTRQQGAEQGHLQRLVARVAREHKVGAFRQMADIWRLNNRLNGVSAEEYYDFELYRPALSPEAKREFVGTRGSFELNCRLAPPMLTHMRGFLSDKVTYTALLTQLGLPVTETQAVFSLHRAFGSLRTLRTEEAIRDFLLHEARYPLFGKPSWGFQAIGSVGIDACDPATGELALNNGNSSTVERVAREIAQRHGDGYVFQSYVAQHPDITAIAGRSISTLRVASVVEENTPRVLYAAWRIASPKAMSDNFWQSGSMIGLVDLASGRVGKVRLGTGPDTQWIDTHPVSGRQLDGYVLPHWDSVMRLVTEAHAMYPVNGFLGWDIAIGPQGAVLVECNENANHTLYQFATGRGVLNADFRPVFDRVAARSQRLLAEFPEKEQRFKTSR